MNPYEAPKSAGEPIDDARFNPADWWSHSWSIDGTPVTVLQREPFRLRWIATKLVTFAFVIHRSPEDIESIDTDYEAMRWFASRNKRTWLPLGVQCGYALLPIYIGESFDDSLIHEVESRFKKRWCVFHVPSLLDSSSGTLHTLRNKSFWGCIYRGYIRKTVAQVAYAAHAGRIAV